MKSEFQLFFVTHRLNMINISTKFQEDTSKGYRDIERTQFFSSRAHNSVMKKVTVIIPVYNTSTTHIY